MATEVGKGYVGIEPDFKRFGSQVNSGVQKETGRIKGAFLKAGQVAGLAMKNAALVAIVGGGVLAKQSIDAASDLNEAISKNDAVFGEGAKAIEKWAGTAAKSFGQSQQQALEAAGTFGNLFQAFGVGQKPAGEMSTILTTIASDLASFNNTPIEEALTAIRSGLSGETEPLKRFGVVLSDVRLKEQALAMGLISSTKDALTPAIKSQAAYALILKDTAIAQGDFGRTSGGLANQQRILGAQFENFKARIGKVLLPVMLAVVKFLNENMIPAFEKVGAWIKDKWPIVTGILSSAWEGFVKIWNAHVMPVWDEIVAAVDRVVQFVVNVWPRIKETANEVWQDFQRAWDEHGVPTMDAIVAGIRAAPEAIRKSWAQIKKTAGEVWASFQDAWEQHGEPVVQAVKTAVEEVSAFIERNWDEIKKTTKDVWTIVEFIVKIQIAKLAAAIFLIVNGIKIAWRLFGDDILRYAKAAWEAVRQIVESVVGIIRGIIAAFAALIKGDWGALWDAIKLIVSNVWGLIVGLIGLAVAQIRFILSAMVETVTTLFSLAWNAASAVVSAVIEAIVQFVINLPGRITSAGSTLLKTVSELVSGAFTAAKDKAKEAVDGIVGFIRDLPGKIKEFAADVLEAGKTIGKKIISGIADGISSAGEIATNIASAVKSAAKGAVNAVIRAVNNAVEFTIPGFGPIPSIHINPPDIPQVAQGGIVKARSGGTLLIAGEAGRDEAIVPLPRNYAGMVAPGAGAPIIITGNTFIGQTEEQLGAWLDQIQAKARKAGFRPAA